MFFSTDALVLRTLDCGENDRLLTLLTPENGRINVLAKGARSKKSKFSAVTQPYLYADFEIYRKSDMNWLRSGSIIEPFSNIPTDIEKLSLSAYLADVACEVTGEFVPAVDILRMTLNSLYAINRDTFPQRLVKAVYEWRVAGYAGYMPKMGECRSCHGGISELMYLDVMNGRLLCQSCLRKNSATRVETSRHYDDTDYEKSILVPMGAGAVAAAGYALSALPERIFSFVIKDEADAAEFCRAAEVYLLNHLERSFDSLEFYKTITK